MRGFDYLQKYTDLSVLYGRDIDHLLFACQQRSVDMRQKSMNLIFLAGVSALQ